MTHEDNSPAKKLLSRVFPVVVILGVALTLLGRRKAIHSEGFPDTRLISITVLLALLVMAISSTKGSVKVVGPHAFWWGMSSLVFIVIRIGIAGETDVAFDVLYAIGFALIVFIASLNLNYRESEKLVWSPLVLLFSVIFAFSVFQGPNLGGALTGYGTGEIAYGRLMAAGALISLVFAVRQSKTSNLWAFGFLPLTLGVLFSASRGVILSFIVVVIAMVTIHFRERRDFRQLRKVSLLVGATLLFFSLFLISLRDNADRVTPLIASKLNETVTLRDPGFEQQVLPYSSGRYEIWDTTIGVILSNPTSLILGQGTASVVIESSQASQHPHNLFLLLLLAGGLVGTGGVLLMLLVFLKKLAKMQIEKTPIIPFLLTLFWVGSAMFSGNFYDNSILIVLLGAAFGFSYGQSETPKIEGKIVKKKTDD